MRLSHARRVISVRFDDPNLVSCAGLAPVLALAARCGLATLLTARLRIAARGVSAERLRALVEQSYRRSPMASAVERAVPVSLAIEIGGT